LIRPVLRVISGSPSGERDGTDAHAADQALLRSVAEGDRAAVRALTRRCLPMVNGLARRMLNDAGEAEDVAQETFIRVWRHASRFDPDRARLETWVGRIAINLCHDRLRKRREVTLNDDAPERADPSADAEQQLTAQDMARRVRKAVSMLPERQRAALELCYFQHMTNIEAAEILEVSVEATESLLARARGKLKAELSSEFGGLLEGFASSHGGET
jgi:RNA polymerase sigma-70 factor (ECF subfamily)